ncbi:MAG: hypothetical protein KGK16_12450, partial [Bradyrhizobium sp.]|nr:hypothetical protein [Bradyrhizobium sp.]
LFQRGFGWDEHRQHKKLQNRTAGLANRNWLDPGKRGRRCINRRSTFAATGWQRRDSDLASFRQATQNPPNIGKSEAKKPQEASDIRHDHLNSGIMTDSVDNAARGIVAFWGAILALRR